MSRAKKLKSVLRNKIFREVGDSAFCDIHFFLFISNLTQFEPSKLLKISIVFHCST